MKKVIISIGMVMVLTALAFAQIPSSDELQQALEKIDAHIVKLQNALDQARLERAGILGAMTIVRQIENDNTKEKIDEKVE